LDNDKPIYLTTGEWEVVNAPSAVDLKRGLVYFVATKEEPTQRHIYSVKLDGSDMQPVTNTSKVGYYRASFSEGSGYALLTYDGPSVPWQKIISTPSNDQVYDETLEENQGLASMVKEFALPEEIYQTIEVDGYNLQVVERRPPHFNPDKKYPVLFYLYGGPGSQMVNRQFTVDFQSYIASTLGYIVVTVDGRGTGYIGRKARCIVRGNLGYYEAHDQIAAAKIWGSKDYVDETSIAIWGWSFGGFMTLKALEQDAGQTFSYGMAVAPVTDWRYYGKRVVFEGISRHSSANLTAMTDSIYTERYMHTPQHNPSGYDNATISDTRALQQNVRFLIMHGVADDNVHLQNTLALIDKLDQAGVENYDVHVFPDSDHSIYFHNAHRMVYDRKFFTYRPTPFFPLDYPDFFLTNLNYRSRILAQKRIRR
jgi:dipeptidyl aminopeptidase